MYASGSYYSPFALQSSSQANGFLIFAALVVIIFQVIAWMQIVKKVMTS